MIPTTVIDRRGPRGRPLSGQSQLGNPGSTGDPEEEALFEDKDPRKIVAPCTGPQV